VLRKSTRLGPRRTKPPPRSGGRAGPLAPRELENHYHALSLYFVFYNFVRIHRTLRVTPAMAAGLTDHVWTTAELLSYRVPAAFLDRLHEIEHLFPSLDHIHQGK
jgi:hypothetical protein